MNTRIDKNNGRIFATRGSLFAYYLLCLLNLSVNINYNKHAGKQVMPTMINELYLFESLRSAISVTLQGCTKRDDFLVLVMLSSSPFAVCCYLHLKVKLDYSVQPQMLYMLHIL